MVIIKIWISFAFLGAFFQVPIMLRIILGVDTSDGFMGSVSGTDSYKGLKKIAKILTNKDSKGSNGIQKGGDKGGISGSSEDHIGTAGTISGVQMDVSQQLPDASASKKDAGKAGTFEELAKRALTHPAINNPLTRGIASGAEKGALMGLSGSILAPTGAAGSIQGIKDGERIGGGISRLAGAKIDQWADENQKSERALDDGSPSQSQVYRIASESTGMVDMHQQVGSQRADLVQRRGKGTSAIGQVGWQQGNILTSANSVDPSQTNAKDLQTTMPTSLHGPEKALSNVHEINHPVLTSEQIQVPTEYPVGGEQVGLHVGDIQVPMAVDFNATSLTAESTADGYLTQGQYEYGPTAPLSVVRSTSVTGGSAGLPITKGMGAETQKNTASGNGNGVAPAPSTDQWYIPAPLTPAKRANDAPAMPTSSNQNSMYTFDSVQHSQTQSSGANTDGTILAHENIVQNVDVGGQAGGNVNVIREQIVTQPFNVQSTGTYELSETMVQSVGRSVPVTSVGEGGNSIDPVEPSRGPVSAPPEGASNVTNN